MLIEKIEIAVRDTAVDQSGSRVKKKLRVHEHGFVSLRGHAWW